MGPSILLRGAPLLLYPTACVTVTFWAICGTSRCCYTAFFENLLPKQVDAENLVLHKRSGTYRDEGRQWCNRLPRKGDALSRQRSMRSNFKGLQNASLRNARRRPRGVDSFACVGCAAEGCRLANEREVREDDRFVPPSQQRYPQAPSPPDGLDLRLQRLDVARGRARPS